MQHRILEPQAISRMRNLELVARQVVGGLIAGRHRGPMHGFSVDFADHRPYAHGDDIRFLDWKVFGRSNRYYIRRFEEETHLQAHLMVDVSRSMAFRNDAPVTKLDYARTSAAALAFLMIHQRDAVGLTTFDRAIRAHVAPSSRRDHLPILLDELETREAQGDTNLAGMLRVLAPRIRKRALIILMSDLLDDRRAVVTALQHFRHRKHEVLIFHLMDPAEIRFPFDGVVCFKDMESDRETVAHTADLRERYRERFEAFARYYREQCGRLNIGYVPVRTDIPYVDVLTRYLIHRARMA